MKIAVFGAGTMGSGIAQVFAGKGHNSELRHIKCRKHPRHKYGKQYQTSDKNIQPRRSRIDGYSRISQPIEIGYAHPGQHQPENNSRNDIIKRLRKKLPHQ